MQEDALKRESAERVAMGPALASKGYLQPQQGGPIQMGGMEFGMREPALTAQDQYWTARAANENLEYQTNAAIVQDMAGWAKLAEGDPVSEYNVRFPGGTSLKVGGYKREQEKPKESLIQKFFAGKQKPAERRRSLEELDFKKTTERAAEVYMNEGRPGLDAELSRITNALIRQGVPQGEALAIAKNIEKEAESGAQFDNTLKLMYDFE